uniref:50S ribosomal protein L13 n=1 Tax=Choreocolax polysiphoniae TaxID=282351 RepID=A0A0B5VQG3_9FLOR|nr:50S ribosomal protein L13 [Choreocolax polysiphoniae]AJH65852.1 50S ribosomal protein L13 [Choreocolax polysiphoniae]
MNKNKTIITNNKILPYWYIIDAKNKNLGRLSSQIIHILYNKHNIEYLPCKKNNINIIIINSKKIYITGKKYEQKTYKRHSGKSRGLKIEIFKNLQERMPNKILKHAIQGMLPKNNSNKKLFKKIKIYQDKIYPCISQTLISLKIN